MSLIVASLAACAQKPAEEEEQPGSSAGDTNKDYLNIYDFGAKGDGSTDDTQAFQNAITRASSTAQPIFIPNGTFLITDTLKLNSVTMYGHVSGAWPADRDKLPKLVTKMTDKPLLVIASGSLSGIAIDCKYPKDTEAEPTIKLTSPGGYISNVKISNPWTGIYFDDSNMQAYNPGRVNIENVFMVSVQNMGVYAAGTLDVANLRNIEVWTPQGTSENFPKKGIGFYFGKNDNLRASDLFVFNAQTGYYIKGGDWDENGCHWGTLSNCSVDYTSYGIVMGPTDDIQNGANYLTVTGGSYWTHNGAIKTDEKFDGYLTVTGAELRSNGQPAVQIGGGKNVSLSGCLISREFTDIDNYALQITGGKNVVVGNSIINSTSKAVAITTPGALVFEGNIITYKSTAIDYLTDDKSKHIVQNNVTNLNDRT